jgi:hypothetical protein
VRFRYARGMADEDDIKKFRTALLKAAIAVAESTTAYSSSADNVAAAARFFSAPVVASVLGVGHLYFASPK